jgi:hypothetical protein
MFALTVEGVAAVNDGQVPDGMCCLDEATAAALAGEFEETVPGGSIRCPLLNACERARAYKRARGWCRKVEEFGRRIQMNFVTGACRPHYGAVDWQCAHHVVLAEIALDVAIPRRQPTCWRPCCAASRHRTRCARPRSS